MTKLTKAELRVLKEYDGYICGSAHYMGVNPRVVMSLYYKGMLRSCNWSRKPSEIDMQITPEGVARLIIEEEKNQ